MCTGEELAEQRPQGRSFQDAGTALAKAQRWEHWLFRNPHGVWCFRGKNGEVSHSADVQRAGCCPVGRTSEAVEQLQSTE